MDPEYLSILMCPKTKGALRLATAEELELVTKFQEEQLSGIDVPLMAVRLRQGLLDKEGARIFKATPHCSLLLLSRRGVSPSALF